MLPTRGVRSVRPHCRFPISLPTRPSVVPSITAKNSYTPATTRTFVATACRRQENLSRDLTTPAGYEISQIDPKEIERVVRDAKQRFRDTLPEGYLTKVEYELYVRLYGAPLRVTEPEDVGILVHDNFAAKDAPDLGLGNRYTTTAIEEHEDGDMRSYPPEKHKAEMVEMKYVELVARSEREYVAMKQLERDLKESQLRATEEKAEELKVEALTQKQAELEEMDILEETEFDTEVAEQESTLEQDPTRPSRLHIHTQDARFGVSPGMIQLPKGRMIKPITEALKQTHQTHLRIAAEAMFGGPGLPDSPVTPQSMKTRQMKPIPVQASHRRMPPINADVIMAAYMPPVYATISGILVELRKRLGSGWLRGMIEKYGEEGPNVLDVGGVGAGIIAWEQVFLAEWRTMIDDGLLPKDSKPKSRKSISVGSDLLRERLARFMYNTSFLPRIPDYVHSVENAERVLDGPQKPQVRKKYDLIVASHQLLPAEEGHKRRAVVNQLWSLLNPEGGVLVIIEKAHPRGFEAIAEARKRLLTEFLLPPGSPPQPEDLSNTLTRIKEPGMVIAPCTTQGKCPLYLVEGKSFGRKDFCYFAQRYIRPQYLQKILNAKFKNNDDVEFSYIAIQRGTAGPSGLQQNAASAARAFEGFETDSTDYHALALPRNIRPPLKKRGHISMDLCTPEGTFERWTISKSFSNHAYRDARKARWGDLWALGAKTRVKQNVRMGRGNTIKDGGVKGRVAKAEDAKAMGPVKKPGVVNLQMNVLGQVVEKQKPMKEYVHTKGGRHMAKSEASKAIRDTEGELDKQLHDSVNKKGAKKEN